MVGREEFMDLHEAWRLGKALSEIARESGRDRKTVRNVLQVGGPLPRGSREAS